MKKFTYKRKSYAVQNGMLYKREKTGNDGYCYSHCKTKDTGLLMEAVKHGYSKPDYSFIDWFHQPSLRKNVS